MAIREGGPACVCQHTSESSRAGTRATAGARPTGSTAASNEVVPSFFDHPSAWNRHDDPDGGECIEIQFAAGGRVLIHTSKPLLFIEPERH